MDDKSPIKIQLDLSGAVLIFMIFVIIILFEGEPNLLGAIIDYLERH